MHARSSRLRVVSTVLATAAVTAMLAPALVRAGDEPHWQLISTSHFSVLTDAGDSRGRDVALRLEQMRSIFGQLLMKTRVNLSEPLDVIAVRSDEEYAKLAPVQAGQLTSASGFFLNGEDRNYIVLNLAAADSWRSVLHDFAGMLLNFNYPPTQPWFDAGFAEYFSSLRQQGKQVQLGGDPGGSAPLSEVLKNSPWVSIPDLFQAAAPNAQSPNPMFRAESWIVMHYLITNNKLSETGAYFGLVENENIPVDKAIENAYGMSSAQLQAAVKAYFDANVGQLEAATPAPTQAGAHSVITSFPPPSAADLLGASSQPVSIYRADALVAEMQVRLPEHRDAGVAKLRAEVGDEKTDSAVVHRALAWVAIQKNQLAVATDELNKALAIDGNDAWSRYYLSLVRYRAAEGSGQYFQGMANMMQDLRAVLDWNPDFADAYAMLGMARVEGGGANSAIEAMRAAILLSPRNLNYQLNMAKVYMSAKKWEAATALLDRLKTSKDPQIASAAKQQLEGLPSLRKYGVMPQETVPSIGTAPAGGVKNVSSATAKKETDGDDVKPAPAEPEPDTRKVLFAKGKLVRVDCSLNPIATLTVATPHKTLKLRTEDYKSLLLIGADQFSCDWRDLPVEVNYKSGGKGDGDLVSLEMQ